MATYINLTPHAIALNDGRIFAPSGSVARVTSSFSDIVDDVCEVQYGEVENLPVACDGVVFIVSAMVLGACKGRNDVVAPATGHPQTIRNEKGHIVSVPCFVRA